MPVIKSRPVVLVTVETPFVPIAILGTIAVVMFVTALVVAIRVAMFGTAFVVTAMEAALVAALEAALVTAFEMAGSGKMPTPTIITASRFRLHSQSYYKY